VDDVLRTIAEFASAYDPESISHPNMDAAARHFVDSIGCAAGAFDSDVAHLVRKYADARRDGSGASTFGLANTTTVEAAAFANGCHVRYLDLNDSYVGPGGGHPSDVIGALLAAAEARSYPGRNLLTSLYVTYEVFGALAEAIPLGEMGWDTGAQCSIAAAAGFANLYGLGIEATANAVSLAITPSMPLRVTRIGELSSWKGCAGPYAGSTALTAANFAELGLTGPDEPFAGAQGFFSHAGEFELSLDHSSDRRSAFERTSFKPFPAVYHAQGPIQMALDLRPRIDVDAIDHITLSTYEGAWLRSGGGLGDHAEKWDPQTRETADHSLPYLVAIALVDGDVTIDSFRQERVCDQALRPLMAKIAVVVDEKLAWREGGDVRPSAKLEISMVDSSKLSAEIDLPKGHAQNPMSDRELGLKCAGLLARVLDSSEAESLIQTLWDVGTLKTLGVVGAAMRSFRTRQAAP
jgi:2-methylcitrate dehydratase